MTELSSKDASINPLEKGLSFIRGDGGIADYEQAAYWLSQAKDKEQKASQILAAMRSAGVGLPCDCPEATQCEAEGSTLLEEALGFRLSLDTHFDCAEQANAAPSFADIAPEFDRCPACGASTLTEARWSANKSTCSIDRGGCGSQLYFEIDENGLAAGLGIQPYTTDSGEHSFFGRMIHEMKYSSNNDEEAKMQIIDEIVFRVVNSRVIDRVVGGSVKDLLIVPAPSSKRRKVQPVYEIAKELSKESGSTYKELLRKRTEVESKDRLKGSELAPGEITCASRLNQETILLVDDTYGEGATLRACINTLKQQGAGDIYFVSLCKNLYGGMKSDGSADLGAM